MYTYIVKGLYIVTILYLLRVSIYTKLLYGGLVVDISNRVFNLPCSYSTLRFFSKTSKQFLRLNRKSSKSADTANLHPHIYAPESAFVFRDINPNSN